MSQFAPPRGMRDFYPEDYRIRETIFSAWRESASAHGFEFYDAPVVETMELLERKAGEEISEQLYTFEDKSGRRLALRGELTPSLARMVISRQRELAFPLKWSAIVQCFRYERMTRGRRREHYQWNLDIIGESGVSAEAEVVAAAVEALQKLGLTSGDFQVHVGSRTLLGELFAACGLKLDHYAACFLALDKRGKIEDKEITALLTEGGVPVESVTGIFEILAIRTLEEAADRAGKDSRAIAELHEFFSAADAMGIGDFVTFDTSIVRGLGYYTGIVFEAFDTAHGLRAIFGGGRYDNLLSSLGGDSVPCVGLGFGDVVVAELLAACGKTPQTAPVIDYAIGYMNESCRNFALRLAKNIRGSGHGCDAPLAAEKAKAFFRRAGRVGARKAFFLGPDEVASGRVRVKTMATGEESEVDVSSFHV